jgi:bifunctional non-homologous end joining protein LigD
LPGDVVKPPAPMLATRGELPNDDPNWVFEFKWDGVRAISVIEDDSVTLWSRNGNEMTLAYPELAPLAAEVGEGPTVLDGEIVVLDEHHRPDFGLLAHRIHIGDQAAAAELAASHPAVYFVFDLLQIGGIDATSLPWAERRRLLESLELDGPSWSVPPVFVGEGEVTLDAASRLDLEGVVAKRIDSKYTPGSRTKSWRKIKLVKRDEFVIGGWTDGSGTRERGFGSLMLGAYDGADLRYVGSVGTGFSDAMLRDLLSELQPLLIEIDPFGAGPPRPVGHFVEPRLIAEVGYGEWTRDLVLRHPSFTGLRFDRQAEEILLEAMDGLGRRRT